MESIALVRSLWQSRNELRYAKSNKESIFTAAQIKDRIDHRQSGNQKNQFALFFARARSLPFPCHI